MIKPLVSACGSSVDFNLLVPKTIANVNGVLKIGSVNGSIELENVEVSKVGNVNGPIKAVLRAVRNDVKISTVNGSVTLLQKTPMQQFEGIALTGKFGPKSLSAQLGPRVNLSTVETPLN